MIDKSKLPIQVSKYVLNKSLGGGNFGQVFLAYDRALDKQKAIKTVELGDLGTLPEKLREAHILEKCSHKNIVRINEANIFEHDGKSYLFFDLELIPNGSAQNQIDTRWLSIQEACGHMSEVLSGLAHAHQMGFIHRDIKPANILIGESSTKLSDFGLATTDISVIGAGRGYTTHLAPEYFPTRTNTQLTDIYAAGITLYRMIVNSKNWHSEVHALSNAVDKIHHGQVISALGYPDFVPGKIKRIINKSCHPDSTKRYQTALEMRQDLDSLRYNISWTKNSNSNWIGYQDGYNFGMGVFKKRSGFELMFFKNNRKDTRRSKLFPSLSDAIRGMESIVQDLTLN